MQTFQTLDVNHDGHLSKEELIEGYSKTMGLAKAREEVNKIFKQIDQDGNGTIDYTGSFWQIFIAFRICHELGRSQKIIE